MLPSILIATNWTDENWRQLPSLFSRHSTTSQWVMPRKIANVRPSQWFPSKITTGSPSQWFLLRRSLLEVQRSGFCLRRSLLGVHRSCFCWERSLLGVHHSGFCWGRSLLGVHHSGFIWPGEPCYRRPKETTGDWLL